MKLINIGSYNSLVPDAVRTPSQEEFVETGLISVVKLESVFTVQIIFLGDLELMLDMRV